MKWQQHGEWLQSDDGRFRISRLDLFHGRSYCAYDWYPSHDWAPHIITVSTDVVEVKRAVDSYIKRL